MKARVNQGKYNGIAMDGLDRELMRVSQFVFTALGFPLCELVRQSFGRIFGKVFRQCSASLKIAFWEISRKIRAVFNWTFQRGLSSSALPYRVGERVAVAVSCSLPHELWPKLEDEGRRSREPVVLRPNLRGTVLSKT